MTDEKAPQYTYGTAPKPASHMAYRPPEPPPPSGYWARFRERVEQWREKNPEQYLEFEREAKQQCELSLERPLKPSQQIVVDAIVAERIRVLKGWPDQLEWEANL